MRRSIGALERTPPERSRISPFERFWQVVAARIATSSPSRRISSKAVTRSPQLLPPARRAPLRQPLSEAQPARSRPGQVSGRAEGGRSHDAQPSLTADEELLEIVAAIVFAERIEAAPDAPIAEHDLEAGSGLGSCRSQHIHAPGVGCDIAADPAAACAPKVIGGNSPLSPPPSWRSQECIRLRRSSQNRSGRPCAPRQAVRG